MVLEQIFLPAFLEGHLHPDRGDEDAGDPLGMFHARRRDIQVFHLGEVLRYLFMGDFPQMIPNADFQCLHRIVLSTGKLRPALFGRGLLP